MSNRKLAISFGGAHPAAVTKTRHLTWAQLCAWLVREPPETAAKEDRGWYCGAEFDPEYRHSDNFLARHVLTWDFDHVDATVWGTVRQFFAGKQFAIYTTFSHTAERPRFRLVAPLSRPTGFDEFQAVSRKLAEKVGVEWVARESHVPAQFMFCPARPAGGLHRQDQGIDGLAIDVDAVLKEYPDWTDRSTWPHRGDGDTLSAKESLMSPADKPGIVGDFCRTFSIEDCIAKFDLPYDKVR